MAAPPIGMTQYCSCKKNKAHLHYSSNHDTAVKSSLALVLVIEGLSSISGAVKGSIMLYLAPDQIYAYGEVNRRITEAIAPYQGMYNLGLGMELLTILLLIMSAATLHSTTKQGLHRVTVYGAVVAFLARWGAYTLYDVKTTQVTSTLGIDPSLLRTANEAQSQFVVAAGFWDSPAFNLTMILLSLLLLGLTAFAAWELYANKVVSVWPSIQSALTPAYAPVTTSSVTMEHAEASFCESCGSQIPIQTAICPTCGHRNIKEPPTPRPKATKFCRHCGAKIPRVSKYCEECGKSLA